MTTRPDRVESGTPSTRRRWVPALAAVVVVILAGGLLVLSADRPGGLAPVARSVAESNQSGLLVRDGDRVEATGRVIGDHAPVLCPLLPQAVTSGAAHPPVCPAQYAVALKNLDVTKLSGSRVVTVTGTWRKRSIDVQTQAIPQARSTAAPDQVPCPAPVGGWSTAPNVVDGTAISRFLAARAGQVTDPALLYPEGRLPGAPEVYTIGVAHGDPAAFRRTFETMYDGNLCVHRARFSKTELTRMAAAVSELIPRGLGVYAAGLAARDKVSVSALVYDGALQNALAPIGPETVDLAVTVRPLR
jgi:hypothetical protein